MKREREKGGKHMSNKTNNSFIITKAKTKYRTVTAAQLNEKLYRNESGEGWYTQLYCNTSSSNLIEMNNSHRTILYNN